MSHPLGTLKASSGFMPLVAAAAVAVVVSGMGLVALTMLGLGYMPSLGGVNMLCRDCCCCCAFSVTSSSTVGGEYGVCVDWYVVDDCGVRPVELLYVGFELSIMSISKVLMLMLLLKRGLIPTGALLAKFELQPLPGTSPGSPDWALSNVGSWRDSLA